MAELDDNHVLTGEHRRSVRAVGLRIAALTGTVLAAGAFAAGVLDDPDQPIDSVVTTGVWPMGSTCCPEETN
jgi:hypothetical protein